MYEGVAELRVKMAHYMRSQQSLISGIPQPAPGRLSRDIRQPLLEKIDEEEQKHDPTTIAGEEETQQ